jgi:sporulation integral membrane protein YtvI
MKDSAINPAEGLYKRLAIRLAILLIILFSIIYVLPFVFHLVSPFVFAILVAAIVNWLVQGINRGLARINKKFIVPNKITTFALNIIVLFLVCFLVFSLVSVIVKEAISLTNNISENWDHIIAELESFLSKLQWHDRVPQGIRDAVDSWVDKLYEKVKDPNLIGGVFSTTLTTTKYVLSATGNILVNFLTFILALFFLAADYEKLKEWTKKTFGDRLLRPFRLLKSSVIGAFGGYIKAQFIIATTAFFYMLLAFVIYGQPYAFLLALVLAIVDLIPILGTIALLLPWGIIDIMGGNYNHGIFFIILGIGFFFIRKVMEPRVLGSQIGLQPLVALFSIYVGLKFSGFLGAILGPMIVMFLISLNKAGFFTNTISDIRLLANRISNLLAKSGPNESLED